MARSNLRKIETEARDRFFDYLVNTFYYRWRQENNLPFREFSQELQQETDQYVEKVEEIFATEEGEVLQVELTELLGKLARQSGESSVTDSSQEQIQSQLQSNNQLTQAPLQKQIVAKESELKQLIDSVELKSRLSSIFYLGKKGIKFGKRG
ncbi:MAG: hypothetical protein MRERV_20c020 [Mycoplasmataceae bacterium RV_VA103A]|nr:MAG: hypothetical protein MRERV_20c020 [Mycoplasmataceae bacterium RV_VA103A]